MIKITVDCNMDEVRIEGKLATVKYEVSYPTEVVKLLEGLLNVLDGAGYIKEVTLTKIDEDREYTIDEW